MTLQSRQRWQQVRDEVLERIHSRTWTPGELIPNETELAIEFGCARATVNRALRSLADDGVLERKRKAGTRVALTPIRQAKLSIPIIRQEIESTGATYSYALVSNRKRTFPTHLRFRLGLAAGTCGMQVEALHLANGQPFLCERRWINSLAIPAVNKQTFDEISPNEWLLRNAVYSHGEIAFSASAADEREAEILNIDPQTPLFTVERVTWDQDTAITWVRMVYRPGYRMLSTL